MGSDKNKPKNYQIPALANNVGQLLRRLSCLLLFCISIYSINAQTPEIGKARINKDQFSIKPNSRDSKVVLRNNNLQRIDRQRKQVMVKKMQHVRQQKIMKPNINKNRRQEMMQRRKQMMLQRNSLRRR